MSYTFTLISVAAANFLGIISPGPAFLLVTRAAAGHSRTVGVVTSLGVAAAVSLWAAAATFGVAALMTRFATIYSAIQLAGGLYLIALGWMAWRHAGESPVSAAATPAPARLGRALLNGFVLTLGNPKVVIFFGSIFVALLPLDAPLWVRIAAVGIVALQETLWYSAVALVFSRPGVQAAYQRLQRRIDYLMGAVFAGLGARLVTLVRILNVVHEAGDCPQRRRGLIPEWGMPTVGQPGGLHAAASTPCAMASTCAAVP